MFAILKGVNEDLLENAVNNMVDEVSFYILQVLACIYLLKSHKNK